MFDWLENIWNGIKDFFGFFASVRQYIEAFFHFLRTGWENISGLAVAYPMPTAVIGICTVCTAMAVILRVVNRD